MKIKAACKLNLTEFLTEPQMLNHAVKFYGFQFPHL
jgi:hypothetical protein